MGIDITFEALIRRLEQRLKETLPAALAHEVMRAMPTNMQKLEFNHKLPPKPGSVLIFIYPEADGSIHFPLIKRPEYTGAHSGQVSFPGGKAEAGETPIETALREANEEVGLKPEEVTVLGILSDFFVIPSNFLVTPVVGYSSKKPDFVPDSFEVVRILDGKLEDLLPDESILLGEILVSKTYQMKAPHFLIENEMVWGATAMMLNEFRTVLKEVISSSSRS